MKLLNENGSKWWQLKEQCNDSCPAIYKSLLNDCDKYLTIFLFNDKMFPNYLSQFALKG